MIKEFSEYLIKIENLENRAKLTNLLEQIQLKYPMLKPKISWGMPVFTNNDTYILGMSSFNQHFSIAPEPSAIVKFTDEIKMAGYKSTKGLFKIMWTDKIDFELICKIIEFNISDKINCKTFWRK